VVERDPERGIRNEASALGEEEWVIRTIGNDLLLTGGRPRGTMYAVYEFLEDHVGCHWLDRKTDVIPAKPNGAWMDRVLLVRPQPGDR